MSFHTPREQVERQGNPTWFKGGPLRSWERQELVSQENPREI